MIRIILSLIIFFLTQSPLKSEEKILSDADICTDMLIKSLENILLEHTGNCGATIQIDYGSGFTLTKRVQTSIEALFTKNAYAITSSYNKSVYTFEIAITDCSIALLKVDDTYERTIMITVHMKCTDSNGTVLFESYERETKSDTIISKNIFNATDNAVLFSRNTKRSVISQNRSVLKIISLALITSVLVYFASQ